MDALGLMAEKLYEDLHFILDAAPRLVRIASMSVICLGLAEGSNDRLLGSNPPRITTGISLLWAIATVHS